MARGTRSSAIARRMEPPSAGSRSPSGHPARAGPTDSRRHRSTGWCSSASRAAASTCCCTSRESLVLHSHLGMRGGWHLYRDGRALAAARPRRLDRARRRRVGGRQLRRLQDADRRARRSSTAIRGWRDSAPTSSPRTSSRRRRLRGCAGRIRGSKLGEALLGQRLVAGIGNIFKSEGCFARRSRPAPSASDRSATSELADVLVATRAPDARGGRIRAAAEAGLPAGGRTLSALWYDRSEPGAGRRRADDLLVPGLPDGLNPR